MLSRESLTFVREPPRTQIDSRTVSACDKCRFEAEAELTNRDLTKAALARKKARGERTGDIPFGMQLKADGVSLELHPEEQRAIDRIATLRHDGHSAREIARRLNEESVKARGSRWHPTTVQRIIKNHALQKKDTTTFAIDMGDD